jgi:hypothetical protein
MSRTSEPIVVNGAPVLTLWAAVVAERLGFDRDEALTLGRAVAGLSAYAKGKSLGLIEPSRETVAERRKTAKHGETLGVNLLGRAIPVVRTPDGLRALSKETPIKPKSVAGYLERAFGPALERVRTAMQDLATTLSPEELQARGFRLYEEFRPEVPAGARGWGAKGTLDLERIARSGREHR